MEIFAAIVIKSCWLLLRRFPFWALDLSRIASYEVILLRLFVRPSVTKSSQDWIIVFFSDLKQDDSWSWYIVTEEARFFKKHFVGPKLGPTGLNKPRMSFFCYFLEFWSLVFLEIASKCRLQQCLVEIKPTKKVLGPKFGQNDLSRALN